MSNKRRHAGHAYGFCVLYVHPEGDGKWVVDAHEELAGLPAYYEMPEEAMDRVSYLRERGVPARMLTLVAERGEVVK